MSWLLAAAGAGVCGASAAAAAAVFLASWAASLLRGGDGVSGAPNLCGGVGGVAEVELEAEAEG